MGCDSEHQRDIEPYMTCLEKLRSVAPLVALAGLAVALAGCQTVETPGTLAARKGDEIIVAGQLFHTGTRVVTWMDPGGYDAYRVERRFAPLDESSWAATQAEQKDISTPNRYNLRGAGLTAEEIERVRGGGWDLATLEKVVDQFVLHYDVCGTSRQCFKILQDMRGLSVHFMLDVDGTIYQTLDLKERAWHASASNTRSVGVEIANMGAYASLDKSPLKDWYSQDLTGTRLTIPPRFGDGGILTKNFQGHPARPQPVVGKIQGRELWQYDFTPEQYDALIKLTSALTRIFPKMKCDYPRDVAGRLITSKLPDEILKDTRGVIGHFHVQKEKVDPGPAFQWDYVIENARRLQTGLSSMADYTSKGHLRKDR